MDVQGIKGRIETLVNERFGGNLKSFEAACKKIDKDNAPRYGALRKYLDEEKPSTPGLDKAAIMAAAGEVPLEWLATGMIKGRPVSEADRKRAEREGQAATLPLLNHSERPVLEAGEYLGFAFKAGDTEQLTIDFVVRGRTERLPIDFAKRE